MAEMLLLIADLLERTREIGLEAAIAELDGTVYDRINGGTFRVVMAEPGFKIYSIGFDGIDDGGPETIGRGFLRNEDGDDMGYWIPSESD